MSPNAKDSGLKIWDRERRKRIKGIKLIWWGKKIHTSLFFHWQTSLISPNNFPHEHWVILKLLLAHPFRQNNPNFQEKPTCLSCSMIYLVLLSIPWTRGMLTFEKLRIRSKGSRHKLPWIFLFLHYYNLSHPFIILTHSTLCSSFSWDITTLD